MPSISGRASGSGSASGEGRGASGNGGARDASASGASASGAEKGSGRGSSNSDLTDGPASGAENGSSGQQRGGGERGGHRSSEGAQGDGSEQGGAPPEERGDPQQASATGSSENKTAREESSEPEPSVEPPQPPVPEEEEEMPEVEEIDNEIDLSDVLETLALLLGATLLVMCFAALLKRLHRHWRTRASLSEEELEPVEGAEALIEELRARAGTRTAEELASSLRYDEAIHALLLRAIVRTLRANPELRSPSLTSREILDRARLSSSQHDALATLVQSAELCVFARRAASEAMYRACVVAEKELSMMAEERAFHAERGDEEVSS